MGNLPRARELFALGARAEPQHLYIWQAWGVAEFRAGNMERARQLFQQGVWADPGSRDVALVFQVRARVCCIGEAVPAGRVCCEHVTPLEL